ncbi:MAG: Ig-like domain-containing protein [Ruminococcus sp.]|nr:Ig-like domain-containing protein [Ruminococcus sp.]
MQKRKLTIAVIAALSVSLSTTFGVMALSTDFSKTEKPAIVQEATETVEETTAAVESSIDRIIGLDIKGAKISGDEGEKVSLKVEANTNDKVKFTSTDKKVATVNSKGVVNLKSKGSAKIVAQVNGEKDIVDVKVNEFTGNNISKDTMAKIAKEIGVQVDHAYPESTIMCSAYSFAYAYYQVKGTPITPGSVWTGGGCNWAGGTVIHCSSAEEMLAAIKKQLDQNKACVGLLSFGSAYTHYVTFYKYTGSGTTLSDFSILDPWDGWMGNAADGHAYSGAGYDVIVIN